MIKENEFVQCLRGTEKAIPMGRSLFYRYWQPLLALTVLTAACFWLIIPSHKVCVVGRALGEHWYSIYNCMLASAAVLFLMTAHKLRKPELSWRAWDLAVCCALCSLGGKLIPLDRPSGGPHGFPSGHALTAFATACLLLNMFPKVSPYAFVIAVAVGWSRVEIREHYPYQVIIGAILGIIVGAAVSHAKDNEGVLLPRLLRKRRGNAPTAIPIESGIVHDAGNGELPSIGTLK